MLFVPALLLFSADAIKDMFWVLEANSSSVFDDFNEIKSKFLFKIFVKEFSSSVAAVESEEDEGIRRLLEFIKIGYGQENWACNFIKTNGKSSGGTENALCGFTKNEIKSNSRLEAKAPKKIS